MLRGIHIQNYSILSDVSLGMTVDDVRRYLAGEAGAGNGLSAISCFIGRNGTGKSATFEGLAFFRDILLHGLPFAASSGERGGFARLKSSFEDAEGKSMHFEFIFERTKHEWLSYSIDLDYDKHRRPFVAGERCLALRREKDEVKECECLKVEQGKGQVVSQSFGASEVSLVDSKFPALALYGRMLQFQDLCWVYVQVSHWYVCKLKGTPDTIPVTREKGGHKHLNEHMDNLRNVLNYMEKEHPEAYERMISRIVNKIPDYKRVGDSVLDNGISSGNLKLFTILLLMEDPRSLICLDEPDNGLYHDMIEAMMREMRSYTIRNKGTQILMTTHHSSVLEGLKPDEVWAFERGEQDKIRTRSVGNDPIVQSMYDEGINLGMLWYGGHLGVE